MRYVAYASGRTRGRCRRVPRPVLVVFLRRHDRRGRGSGSGLLGDENGPGRTAALRRHRARGKGRGRGIESRRAEGGIMKARWTAVGAGLCLSVALVARAQEKKAEPPKPGPEV